MARYLKAQQQAIEQDLLPRLAKRTTPRKLEHKRGKLRHAVRSR